MRLRRLVPQGSTFRSPKSLRPLTAVGLAVADSGGTLPVTSSLGGRRHRSLTWLAAMAACVGALPATAQLVGTNDAFYLEMDAMTGNATPVSGLGLRGFQDVYGLAFDPNTDTLYGTDINTDQLITINTTTGAGTAVGALGFNNVQGLAFDPNTNTLYGTDVLTDQLITINTTTGAGTAVGALGFDLVLGLAFDPNTDTLYGTDFFTDQLITINTSTGFGTAVGPTRYLHIEDLEFVPLPITVYVDAGATDIPHDGSSWCNAFLNVQDALTVAQAGDTIRVANGTYKPDQGGGQTPGDRSATFQLINGVTLEGGYAGCGAPDPNARDIATNETILSGDLLGNDAPVACVANSPDCDSFGGLCADGFCIIKNNNAENSYHVVTGSGTDPTAILDGMTITAGNANGAGPDLNGAGMFNLMGSPSVTHCTFIGNAAGSNGGGLRNFTDSSPTVTDCLFVGNFAGSDGAGMVNNLNCSPTVTNCKFLSNTASGTGGGMWNINSSHPALTNCIFSGNTAPIGGGINNRFTSDPSVSNCTFSNNLAIQQGGGIHNGDISSPAAVNCIFWGNSDAGGSDESAQIHTDSGAPTVNYSIVQGGWTGAGGTGIVNADPQFIDANGLDGIVGTADDNLRLRPGSPAIDAGDSMALPADVADLDGDGNTAELIPMDLAGFTRQFDDPDTADTGVPGSPVVDMGAYEFHTDCDGNGLPDECDLDCGAQGGLCNVSGCGTVGDCDANGALDVCDIAQCDPDLDPTCDDCNNNGRPDKCDVPNSTGCPAGNCTVGCFADVDENCVPDQCVEWLGTGGNDFWNNAANWDAGVVPNNGVNTFNVVISGAGETVILDIDAAVDSLRMAEGTTLLLNFLPLAGPPGDLTIETAAGIENGGAIEVANGHSLTASLASVNLARNCAFAVAGGCTPPSLQMSGGGEVIAGGLSVTDSREGVETGGVEVSGAGVDKASITLSGELKLDRNGIYQEDPAVAGNFTDASLTAGSALITNSLEGAGSMILTDGMTVQTSGDFVISSSLACRGLSSLGGCTPPSLVATDFSQVIVGGSFILSGNVDVCFGTNCGPSANATARQSGTVPVLQLNGNFDDQSTAPSAFDWTGSLIQLLGTGQTFEVAGADFGLHADGLTNNPVLGTIEVGPGASVTFADAFSNVPGTEALYLDELILRSGSQITLDGVNVYYLQYTDEGGTISGSGSAFDLNCTTDPDCQDGSACTKKVCGVGGLCENVSKQYGDLDQNGTISLFDLFCVLDGFSKIFTNCAEVDVDLDPCPAGNGTINLGDLFAVLNAFSDVDPCCGG